MKNRIKLPNLIVKTLTVIGCLLVLLTINSFAQKKSTKSPCVEFTTSGEHNNIHYYWKNPDSAECKSAVEALRPASLLILGFDTEKDSFGELRLQEWLIQIGGDPQWNAKFKDGLTFGDASNWLKETRSWVDYQYNKIPLEIYGRSITAQEQTDYRAAVEAKKSWYAPLFLAEKQKLNNNPAEREAMINRAYQKVYNRSAGLSEMQRWKPGSGIYREIVAQLQKEFTPKIKTEGRPTRN